MKGDVITVNTTAADIARALRLEGIPVISVSEADETVDGEIAITPGLHVQVGEGYAITQRDLVEGGQFVGVAPVEPGADQTSFSALLASVRKGLAERRPNGQ